MYIKPPSGGLGIPNMVIEFKDQHPKIDGQEEPIIYDLWLGHKYAQCPFLHIVFIMTAAKANPILVGEKIESTSCWEIAKFWKSVETEIVLWY